jgi:hypothetical protein
MCDVNNILRTVDPAGYYKGVDAQSRQSMILFLFRWIWMPPSVIH